MEERGYQVLRLLGQGGQGRVYEVRSAKGEVCVLKQLPWVGELNQTQAMQEVRLLSSLRHPCIVPYLDSFLARSVPSIPDEDILCLIMSRCEHDLRHECLTKLASGGGDLFSEAQVLSWFAQLCWGLQHLHARRFLHRDLKPQNVLLTRSRQVQLADFGVAGHLEHSQDFRRSVVGTPSFMSPEMLEGRPYGLKTDIWALGCVLYEIMALEAPFKNCGSYAAIVVAVLQHGPLCAPPGYSKELSVALEALLARKPDARPSSAELLGGHLLSNTFRDLLQYSKERMLLEANCSSAPRAPSVATEEYQSDFESYSGSDDNDNQEEITENCEPAVAAVADDQAAAAASAVAAASAAVDPAAAAAAEWRQLQAEAEAWLQPPGGRTANDPRDEARRVRGVLRKTLRGSSFRVESALDFLRSRRPLLDDDVRCEAEIDEVVLQIEVVDLFGDEGLQALPLLERCLELESQISAGSAASGTSSRSSPAVTRVT